MFPYLILTIIIETLVIYYISLSYLADFARALLQRHLSNMIVIQSAGYSQSRNPQGTNSQTCSKHVLNVWRMISVNAALLTLAQNTETHGEAVYDAAW